MCKRFAKHIMDPPTADSFVADLAVAGKAEPEREQEIMANETATDNPELLKELLRVHCAAGHPHNRVLQRVRDRGSAGSC